MNSDTTDSGQQGQPSDTEASREQDEAVGVEVPFTQLSADALRGVIESFVLQEGTEYGAQDYSLEDKVSLVMLQLERSEAKVMFDTQTQSVNILVTR